MGDPIIPQVSVFVQNLIHKVILLVPHIRQIGIFPVQKHIEQGAKMQTMNEDHGGRNTPLKDEDLL